MPTEWLTIIEACHALSVSKRTLYTYMESEHLLYYQLGGQGHRRIKAEDLDNLMVASGPAGMRPLHSVETGFDMDHFRELVRHIVESTIRQLNGSRDAADPASISDTLVVSEADLNPKEAGETSENKKNEPGWFPFVFDFRILRSPDK